MILQVLATGSKGNCYTLTADSGEILVLDFGIDYRKIVRGIDYRPADIVGALLTHEHADHSLSHDWFRRNGIKVYSNPETAAKFDAIAIEHLKKAQIGDFTVTGFNLPHTHGKLDESTGEPLQCPNFGYHIKHTEMGQLVYMTDFMYPTVSFKKAKIDHILCEVNYCSELVEREDANFSHRINGHLSLETFLKSVLAENVTENLKDVTLCHLSDTAADEKQILRAVKEKVNDSVFVNIAKPGLKIKLKKGE